MSWYDVFTVLALGSAAIAGGAFAVSFVALAIGRPSSSRFDRWFSVSTTANLVGVIAVLGVVIFGFGARVTQPAETIYCVVVPENGTLTGCTATAPEVIDAAR